MPHRLKKRVLEKRQALVIARLSTGHTQAEVAREFGATTGAVAMFVARHSDEIDAMTAAYNAKLTETTFDTEIEQKGYRIREYGEIYNDSKNAALAAEATDKAVLHGTAMKALRSVAEETGQLPKTDQNINVRQQVLLRIVEGSTEQLG